MIGMRLYVLHKLLDSKVMLPQESRGSCVVLQLCLEIRNILNSPPRRMMIQFFYQIQTYETILGLKILNPRIHLENLTTK